MKKLAKILFYICVISSIAYVILSALDMMVWVDFPYILLIPVVVISLSLCVGVVLLIKLRISKAGIGIICGLIVLLIARNIYVGGTPHIENFNDYEDDYMVVVNLALEEYKAWEERGYDEISIELSYDDMYINAYDNPSEEVKHLDMTEAERESLRRVQKSFYRANGKYDYLWVSDDYVIFWEDEMKEYGLIYSHTPFIEVIKMNSDWYGGDYRRINKNWYEIGFFGL